MSKKSYVEAREAWWGRPMRGPTTLCYGSSSCIQEFPSFGSCRKRATYDLQSSEPKCRKTICWDPLMNEHSLENFSILGASFHLLFMFSALFCSFLLQTLLASRLPTLQFGRRPPSGENPPRLTCATESAMRCWTTVWTWDPRCIPQGLGSNGW